MMILRYLLAALLLQTIFLHTAAQNLGRERSSSVYTYIYKIPAIQAQNLHKNNFNAGLIVNYSCVDSFFTDSAYARKLPVGHYLFVKARREKLELTYKNVTDVTTTALADFERTKFVVSQTSTAAIITNAVITLNGRTYAYDTTAKAWIVPFKKHGAAVTVSTVTDTTFYNLSYSHSTRRLSGAKILSRFRSLAWRIKYRFETLLNLRKKVYPNYVVFSKPKYYPNDTVKVKAFITKPNGKPFKAALSLQLMRNDYSLRKICDTLKPVTPGAYVFSFALNDSLVPDRYYTLYFNKHRKESAASAAFKVEDYLLNVNTFTASAGKTDYNLNDTLLLDIAGRNFNGLPVMDANVKLTATTENISSFAADRVFVPDTVFAATGQLDADGHLKYPFVFDHAPKATFKIKVAVHLTNGNNEMWDTTLFVNYNYARYKLLSKQVNDSIETTYFVDGLPATGKGKVIMYGINHVNMVTTNLNFPCTLPLNPAATAYSFVSDSSRTTSYLRVTNCGDWQGYGFRTDTLATFIISNNDHMPFRYTIFRNTVVVATGMTVSLNKSFTDGSNALYAAAIQYECDGVPFSKKYFALRQNKALHVEVQNAAEVFPGQRDTFNISVKDFKGKPAAAVNITAYSANAQFGAELKMPDVPSYNRGRRLHIRLHEPTLNNLTFFGSYNLCCLPGWQQRLRLDSLPYYQFVLPEKLCSYYYDSIPYISPQLAIYVYSCGRQVKIYNVHLDGTLKFTSENQFETPYSFETTSGEHTLRFRLKDREFSFSKIKLFPGYKLEISYNYDSLLNMQPKPNSKPEYSKDELRELQDHTLSYIHSYDDYSEGAFLWQGNQVFGVPNRYGGKIIAGPLKPDSMMFCRNNRFVLTFMPENNYAYSFAPGQIRLEKYEPFAITANKKHFNLTSLYEQNPKFFGEIASSPKPVFTRLVSHFNPYHFSHAPYGKKAGFGVLEITPVTDSVFDWVLLNGNTSGGLLVNGGNRSFYMLEPGIYNVLMATAAGNYIYFDSLTVQPNGVNYAALRPARFLKLATLSSLSYSNKIYGVKEYVLHPVDTTQYGNGCITGRVSINDSLPVPYAMVNITQDGKIVAATFCDIDGNFVLVLRGHGVFTISATAGDCSLEDITNMPVKEGFATLVHINLQPAPGHSLGEVEIVREKEKMLMSEMVSTEVISYGISRDKFVSVPGVMLNESFESNLQYSALGLRGRNSERELMTTVTLGKSKKANRASSGYGEGGGPADGEPAARELKDKYSNAKTLRTNFKDEGFWQPNLVTDKQGHASFPVQYPDNLTSWRAFVIAMDGKRRSGAAVKNVRSFKDVSATLATPGFLIEGDSTNLVGEAYNYTHQPLQFAATYKVNNEQVFTRNIAVSSATDLPLPLVAPAFKAPADTVTAQYSIALSNGFADGEERKIPVLQRGTIETKGFFTVLHNDSTLSYVPDTTAGVTTIHAEGDLLPVLLEEIKNLKEYPYWCVEQTASRLMALTAEQQIDSALGIKFKGTAERKNVIKKLLGMQLYGGGFGWWQNCEADIYITNYVLQALNNAHAGADNTVSNAMQSATAFLQQSMPYMNREEKLNTLETLAANSNLTKQVKTELQMLAFDSLSLQQQLRLYKATLICGADNKSYWQKILQHKYETVFGGAYFGDETYCFYNNTTATTLTAFNIATLLANAGLQQQIINYFLTTRNQNGWRNTYESANILAAILPQVLKQRGGSTAAPRLSVNGSIVKLPYTGTYAGAQPVHIEQQGKAPVYLTAYQKFFNRNPVPVSNLYQVHTSFIRNNETSDMLKAGEVTQLQVNIHAEKYAEYISIEVPIPAGCTYNSKEQPYNNGEIHREYYKNKVLIFCRRLSPGSHTFNITLQSRYTGRYTLNPTRIELMYFPTLYGRNAIRQVEVKE